MAAVAHEVGARFMVDMAHIAGLVATGAHPSRAVRQIRVTSTSHKTLRGPRGGFILTNDEDLARKIDKAVFPGTQGGPLMHVIAGKAVAFGEALQPAFAGLSTAWWKMPRRWARAWSPAVCASCRAAPTTTCAWSILRHPDTGRDAERFLDEAGLTVNKNSIPGEPRSPFVTSGIRVGSAAGARAASQPTSSARWAVLSRASCSREAMPPRWPAPAPASTSFWRPTALSRARPGARQRTRAGPRRLVEARSSAVGSAGCDGDLASRRRTRASVHPPILVARTTHT